MNTNFNRDEIINILNDKNILNDLIKKSAYIKNQIFGNKVFFRGLIEFSNYCKNDCYYCGINCRNLNINRYRLSKQQILDSCNLGYSLGFRTFVLQSGEDPYFTKDKICDIVYSIRNLYNDCAITLSIGEWKKQDYKDFYNSGANRYLLRHETADENHYKKLHSNKMSFKNRIDCIYNLKEIGFQVGAGFMVGSPYQTPQALATDIEFIKKLKPQMVGIGPFIPHKATKFKNMPAGALEDTLKLLAITRLTLNNVLLPATTALGTICENGREQGLLAGANVVMPNLTPKIYRNNYSLYNNKISTKEEAVEGLDKLRKKLKLYGLELVSTRGDYVDS